MAYQLQPGMKLVQNPVTPPVCATDEIFTYPKPSSLNYGSRPNTMLYGTAPFMAGKGAPAEFIETSDALRPQSTSQFNKIISQTYEKNHFPLQHIECGIPLRTMSYEPASTRAEVQNAIFKVRYQN
ncbi:MAG: hypothetical protein HOI07_03575 [Betaproteobacteria bacterium]|jgi:hypothetical protein|nr:hypothetical protein [Betaproteobacteria bacterium]